MKFYFVTSGKHFNIRFRHILRNINGVLFGWYFLMVLLFYSSFWYFLMYLNSFGLRSTVHKSMFLAQQRSVSIGLIDGGKNVIRSLVLLVCCVRQVVTSHTSVAEFPFLRPLIRSVRPFDIAFLSRWKLLAIGVNVVISFWGETSPFFPLFFTPRA